MIRVGFVVADSSIWVGGLVYLRNLLQTIMGQEGRTIEPILIASSDVSAQHLEGFDNVEVLRTPLVRSILPLRVIKRANEQLLGRNLLLESYLRLHRIDVLSHSGHLGARASVPTISWIPDFQHMRMPSFFSISEIEARDRNYRKIADWSSAVILSSEDARRDLGTFAPSALSKSHVLHFVAGMVHAQDPRGAAFLKQTYGIDRPYFYLPNQFWTHKNHRLVVDALGILAKEGQAPLVVCTGHTEDRRSPAAFSELMDHAAVVGAAPFFKVLGVVPYADISVLMNQAVSLINPSHFEGWSTTVEEAKSLGKAIILSDIPVHQEQAPGRATYVPVDDPQAVAAAMLERLAAYSETEETDARRAALESLPARKAAFAATYERIVAETLGRRRKIAA